MFGRFSRATASRFPESIFQQPIRSCERSLAWTRWFGVPRRIAAPLSAIVLGAYTDHNGRRAGLILALTLMSVGIFSIACTPGYSTIGLLAPLLVLTGRLLQGFSAGMELGGVSVYLSKIATPGHKGFYVS